LDSGPLHPRQQTWKLSLCVPQAQFWPVTGSSRACAIFRRKPNIKPLAKPKIPQNNRFCSNLDFWVQNKILFRPFCPTKSDFGPKSEKIGPFRYLASVWFLTSALLVPQARLWCLRLFSCLQDKIPLKKKIIKIPTGSHPYGLLNTPI